MEEINYSIEGTVFNLQRYSIHDGPGIRTIVFLKGCPLACRWCSNPESQNRQPELLFNAQVCIRCGRCISACSRGALSLQNPDRVERSRCSGCGKCQSACLNGALERKGDLRTVEWTMEQLKKDSTYYRRSGGGVTLSGGEPLLQPEFAAQLLKACHALGWNTAIETTLFASEAALRQVLPHVDHALVDIKHMDPEQHQAYTGQRNEMILENARLAAELAPVTIRVPLIPGFNVNDGSDKVIREICEFAKTLKNVREVHLLPYHTYGENKYRLTGREYGMPQTESIPAETIAYLKAAAESCGLICAVGG